MQRFLKFILCEIFPRRNDVHVMNEGGQERKVNWFRVIAILAFILASAWFILSSEITQLEPRAKEVAFKVIDTVGKDFSEVIKGLNVSHELGNTKSVVIVVVPLAGDPTGELTNQLRDQLNLGPQGGYGPTKMEKIRNYLGLRQMGYSSREMALKQGRDRGSDVDVIVYGSVEDFRGGERASISMKVSMISAKTARAIIDDKIYMEPKPVENKPISGNGMNISLDSRLKQAFGWMIFTLLLPVFTMPFMRAMMKKRSNSAGAFMLGLYTLADVLLAYILIGDSMSLSNGLIYSLIAAIIASVIYNILMLGWAAHLEA